MPFLVAGHVDPGGGVHCMDQVRHASYLLGGLLPGIGELGAGVDLQGGIAMSEAREGDRVEIYRPLQADPKEARRKRAAQNKPPKAA